MNANSFTKIMSLKSNKELEIILKEKNDYNQEAIQAVVWEMEVRNLIQKTDDLYKDTFKESDAIQPVEKAIDHNEHLSREMLLPHLYSKRAIQGFTLFFSTIFGVLLLMQNLKEMNKPVARNQVLFFGIAYTTISAILLNYLPKMFFVTLLFNMIGYAILSEFFWNKNLGNKLTYQKKEIWKPLIISFAVMLLLLLLQFLPQILGV
jgi:magnesium-transporting ATPase (P-type)